MTTKVEEALARCDIHDPFTAEVIRDLLKSAMNADLFLDAIYVWVDRIVDGGGFTSISGVATGQAMLESLKNNRKRVKTLVREPLKKAIKSPQNME